jgi:hypothetical protein
VKSHHRRTVARVIAPDPRQVLTTEQLAAWMDKSPRTVIRMRLPTISPGRYLFSQVLEELEQRRKARRMSA